ncbi:13621_t:CDS:2, partial [Gigaspora margarita]
AEGITQKVSIFQAEFQNQKITFLDTSEHSNFIKMQQRGNLLNGPDSLNNRCQRCDKQIDPKKANKKSLSKSIKDLTNKNRPD